MHSLLIKEPCIEFDGRAYNIVVRYVQDAHQNIEL